MNFYEQEAAALWSELTRRRTSIIYFTQRFIRDGFAQRLVYGYEPLRTAWDMHTINRTLALFSSLLVRINKAPRIKENLDEYLLSSLEIVTDDSCTQGHDEAKAAELLTCSASVAQIFLCALQSSVSPTMQAQLLLNPEEPINELARHLIKRGARLNSSVEFSNEASAATQHLNDPCFGWRLYEEEMLVQITSLTQEALQYDLPSDLLQLISDFIATFKTPSRALVRMSRDWKIPSEHSHEVKFISDTSCTLALIFSANPWDVAHDILYV